MPYNPALREHAANEVDEQRIAKGLTWRALAERLGKPPVWATAAPGIASDDPGRCREGRELLELSDETVRALQRQPYRTADPVMASDPTIYRFHELLAVYGPAFKALIHEQFGDGIMSAINCSVDVSRREHPDGARVVVSIDGKFLPYQWGA